MSSPHSDHSEQAIASAVLPFYQDMAFSNVSTSEKQAIYEQEERRKHPFNLHDSRRILIISFYLYLVYLCPPTVAAMDTIYWEPGNVKIWKIITK